MRHSYWCYGITIAISESINNAFETEERWMKKYMEQIKKEILAFERLEIKQIPKGGNVHTNSLATLALTSITE